MDSLVAERAVCLFLIEDEKKELAELQFSIICDRELCNASKLSRLETEKDSESWNDFTDFIEVLYHDISHIVTQCEIREEKLRELYTELNRIQIEISKLETELQKAKDTQQPQKPQLHVPATATTKKPLR